MKLLLTTFFLLLFTAVFAQDKRYIHTDSSTIEIDENLSGSQSIHEYIKGKNLVRWTSVNAHGLIETRGQLDTLEHPIGTWYQYDEKGILSRIENFENRTWTAVRTEHYPYKRLVDKIKAKADSIVAKTYGREFLRKHAKWDFSQSYMYFEDESGTNWTDTAMRKPVSFLIRYDVVHEGVLYDDLIEFEIDAQGKFKPNEYEEIYGFEKRPASSSKAFTLTKAKAIRLAKQMGLIETDSTKAAAFLHWENFKTEQFYKGHFRFYVVIKTGSIKASYPKAGRASRTSLMSISSIPGPEDLLKKER